jgi:hypothetical protein
MRLLWVLFFVYYYFAGGWLFQGVILEGIRLFFGREKRLMADLIYQDTTSVTLCNLASSVVLLLHMVRSDTLTICAVWL